MSLNHNFEPIIWEKYEALTWVVPGIRVPVGATCHAATRCRDSAVVWYSKQGASARVICRDVGIARGYAKGS